MGIAIGALALLMGGWSACGAADGPAFSPLTTEISAEHPLLVFAVTPAAEATPEAYVQRIIDDWNQLPSALKPLSALELDGPASAVRQDFFPKALAPLQTAGVPVVVRVGEMLPGKHYPQPALEELLRDNSVIKGIAITALPVDEYNTPLVDDEGVPLAVRWAAELLDTAARYGRFVYMPLDRLQWPRLLSQPAWAPLREKMTACKDYAIPTAWQRGPNTIGNQSAALGCWLVNMAAQWGVAADSRWYSDARFLEPGVSGMPTDPAKIPSSLYRAMLLNGAMTGAAVYGFPCDADLWFGANKRHWDAAILPTLLELLDKGIIAHKDPVMKKARIAYKLQDAPTPARFHTNLQDLDGVLDAGWMIRGAYGMEHAGQAPELILNTANRYWIPVLPSDVGEALARQFDNLLIPGQKLSAKDWQEFCDARPPLEPAGTGKAYLIAIDRGIFVMNTRENTLEAQPFSLPAVPAPVHKASARRDNDTIELTWPFRDEDVSYTVFKRVMPETRFTPVAKGVLERTYADKGVGADQTVAYAVTALTGVSEPYTGTVGYGEYLALSGVESRITEEVVISPLLTTAESTPVPAAAPPAGGMQSVWPSLDGLDEGQQTAARAIAGRIEQLESALAAKDLTGVMDLYAAEYQDPQGWRLEYVRRAWQWLFERYGAPRMARQIRRWDFSALAATGQVDVTLYLLIQAAAVTDAEGRRADTPIVLPRTDTAEVRLSFNTRDGVWRILTANPALPSFRDILSYSAGADAPIAAGPDQYGAP